MEGGGFALAHDGVTAPDQLILCCECGVAIPSNPAAMCPNCIRTKIDITDGIPKQGTVYFCRNCERYLNPPNAWIKCELESRELLALLLKRIKGLNKVRLVDAGFVWTEPHSKRIKTKLTVQKEVFSGAILQQMFVVEFVVTNQMCTQCHRVEAKDTWNAVAQVRQKVPHKRTFFYVEQLIIKHGMHTQTVGIKSLPDGIDFFFDTNREARKFCEFLQAVVPLRIKQSEKLISHDIQSSVYNYKFTHAVEIVPICKEEVVCLPPATARYYGCISPVVLCSGIGTTLHLLDPYTLQVAEVLNMMYWKDPFRALLTCDQLIEYTVLDIEPVRDAHGQPISFKKWSLAEAIVVKVRDFGVNDLQYTVRTHLGRFLQPGDNVLGYDLQSANFNDENANHLDFSKLPEVMLVKKSFRDKRRRQKKRNWKLKFLAKEEMITTKKDEEAFERDQEMFMQELEEDKDMRDTVNIYKDPDANLMSGAETDDDELKVPFEEMLDDFDGLAIGGGGFGDDGEGGDGAGPADPTNPADMEAYAMAMAMAAAAAAATGGAEGYAEGGGAGAGAAAAAESDDVPMEH